MDVDHTTPSLKLQLVYQSHVVPNRCLHWARVPASRATARAWSTALSRALVAVVFPMPVRIFVISGSPGGYPSSAGCRNTKDIFRNSLLISSRSRDLPVPLLWIIGIVLA